MELARIGAHRRPRKLTSVELSRHLNIPQQTVARYLTRLAEEGLIARTTGPRGQEIEITPAGLAKLHSVYSNLAEIFGDSPRTLKLSGKVVSGLGEGKYYMSQAGYVRQFERKFGLVPYEGTLDVELDSASVPVKEMLRSLPGTVIEGFETEERTFGPVTCFEARLRGERVYVVLPQRTHYTNVMELAAAANLRKKLKLSDGDRIKIEVVI